MSALGLNLVKLAGPGRLAIPVAADYVRDLTEDDLHMMARAPLGSVAPNVKRLTDRHHALARLLAAGTPIGEAALIIGYDISRVSILQDDPAFQELLALYKSEVKKEFISSIQHMAGLTQDALLVLRERIEENPDRFTNNELMKMAAEFIDRTTGEDVARDMPELIELVAPE